MLRKSGLMLAILCIFSIQSAHAAQSTAQPLSNIHIDVQQLVDGLQLPTFVGNAGDDRLFIVEKPGRIRIVKDGKLLDTPFLDITSIVNAEANERGLLSFAFHPDYKTNGLFFVYYTAETGDVTIARYKVSSNPDVADPNSAKTILTVSHPISNHNGGQLQFGPDGYLYIGIGDGGSEGDPNHNGQNRGVLLSKLLRIDVNNGDPYAIPSDNPFASNGQGKPEIWAYGLRNPWRFSFDSATGDLYIGDVGQDTYEEVDVQKAKSAGGQNYGWNTMEATHCYQPTDGCDQTGITLPVTEYTHGADGCSISGGYVYRGTQFPDLVGTYFFGDYCSGKIWGMQPSDANGWTTTELLSGVGAISSFGQGHDGELYVVDINKGIVYHLVEKTS